MIGAALRTHLGASLTRRRPRFVALSPRADGSLAFLTPERGSGVGTFTRASTALVRNWEGIYRECAVDEPRVEGARRVRNLLQRSQKFDFGYWSKVGVIITPNAALAPDGTLTADKWIADSGTNLKRVERPFTFITGVTYTASFYAKAAEFNQITVRFGSGGLKTVIFDLAAETVSIGSEVSGASAAITAVGDGWYRCAYTHSTDRPQTGVYIGYTNANYTGNDSDGFFIWGAQLEVGASASEYLATVAAEVTRHYWRALDGTSLHPTRLIDGVAELDYTIPVRTLSTAYSVGQRIIPINGGMPAGGNGYWYECTVAGTSDTGSPTWPTTVGNTVVDGGVTWRCAGLFRVAGYESEGASTNSWLDSRNFGNSTTWLQTNTPTLTQDQVGIDGVANTAWTLADNDDTVIASIRQQFTIADDSATHCAAVFIAKDSNESRFPRLAWQFINGTTSRNLEIRVNTKTGASYIHSSAGTSSHSITDAGDWWRVLMSLTNNSTGNTLARFTIVPVDAATLTGAADSTLTGSIVVDQADLRLNTALMDSPIITTSAAVTRASEAGNLQWPQAGNFNNNQGMCVFDWTPGYDSAATGLTNISGLLTLNSDSSTNLAYFLGASPGSVRTFAGGTASTLNTGGYSAGQRLRLAIRWNLAANQYQIGARNLTTNSAWAWGTLPAYSGYTLTGGLLRLLATNNAPNRLANLRLYDRDRGTAYIQARF